MKNNTIISGSSDCSAIMWDKRKKKLVNIMNNHTSGILGVDFVP